MDLPFRHNRNPLPTLSPKIICCFTETWRKKGKNILKSQEKDNESRRDIGKGKEQNKYYCNSDDNKYDDIN